MVHRDRMKVNKNAVANIAAVGLFALGAAVAFPAAAAADPPPPPDPALPAPADPPPPPGPPVPVIGVPLGPAGFNVLQQTGIAPNDVPGGLGAPVVNGLDAASVLGQNPLPSPPGANPGTPPNLNLFNNAYGAGAINDKPAAPGQGQQFGVAPGDENADVTRRQWLGRYIDLLRAGDLRGGLLGQMPQQQLGESLPGTAPPPGTNIPPGLVQYLPDPADAPPPGAPPAPPRG